MASKLHCAAGEAAGEDTLAPLRAHLEPASFREIVALYESTVRDRAASLATAVRLRDLDGVRRNTHDLAGMCGQLGASRATALARRIERACEEGRGEHALALALEIAPAVEETLAALAGTAR